MLKIEEEKRRSLVLSFLQLLRSMDFGETAAVLASEASLEGERNIEQDVKQIMEDETVEAGQRSAIVASFCKQSIQNCLKQGKIDEALQIYEVIVPVFCPSHIEEFSLLFAQNYEGNPQKALSLLQTLLDKRKATQQTAISCIGLKREVWFMKDLGQGILLVDRDSNAVVIVQGEERFKREKLHKDKIFTVACEGQRFATGSIDRTVKVWDKKIILLHTIDLHRARINAIAFCQGTITCFDQDSVISVHSLPETMGPSLQRIAIFRTASPFSDACYWKSAKKILGVTHQGTRSFISKLSISKKRVDKVIEVDKRIYGIELSKDEKVVFANVAPCEIRAYCIASRAVVMVVKGFTQQKNLMRMSQGGPDGNYLAVSSEEGSVRIYKMGESEGEEVLRVIAQSHKSVNCVLWKGEDLFFTCDGGNLQHLSPPLERLKKAVIK